MAEIKKSYGDSHIRKSLNYKKQDDYTRTITVRMESETELTAEEIAKLQKVFDEMFKKLKKVVEEF